MRGRCGGGLGFNETGIPTKLMIRDVREFDMDESGVNLDFFHSIWKLCFGRNFE